MNLFPVFCHECEFYKDFGGNSGICMKKGFGNLSRDVYENAVFCEMDRRKFNDNILQLRLKGEITHYEMYRRFKRS